MLNPALSGIFSIQSDNEFNAKALEIFRYQAKNCTVYNQFISHLRLNINHITKITEVPFLPIELFKTHTVLSIKEQPDLYFTSSGTTTQTLSRHYIYNPELYKQSAYLSFSKAFGEPKDYCILALLPGYLERKESSLVYMVNYLQQLSQHPLNGNFLSDFDQLNERLIQNEKNKQKTILIGVSHALIDFSEQFKMNLKHTLIIETGGMKGKRKELTRNELHGLLQNNFGVNEIYSEYGMTELLSQAYFKNGKFDPPPWMKILIRDKTDPLTVLKTGSGGINVIDLANYYSCSFIATGDAGTLYDNGHFEVKGRIDNQDIRGCNLIYV